MKRLSSRPIRAALGSLLCCIAVSASAQWSWTDKEGRKVFSDQPPPANIAEASITRRPDPSAGASPKVPASPNAAGKPVGTDPALADKLKRAGQAETGRKTAEQERAAATRADNCSRAQQARATYDSGITLVRINPQGQREVLDQDARDTETRRLDTIIASDCR